MKFLNLAKRMSIAGGLYRPARWVVRHVRPHELHTFKSDVELYQKLLPQGALCFDVGSNIGAKSEALLEAGAQVVAFEPNPLVRDELTARCGYQPEWSLVEAALGQHAGITTLYARRDHGQSSLTENWEGEVLRTFAVPVLTLDLAMEYFGRPFYCKIDVEGWELEVLEGLSAPIPLVSFEFHLLDRDISKSRLCLERLIELLGNAWVNLTPAESADWHFDDWIPLEAFTRWFPGDLSVTLPRAHYGDIFVAADVPSTTVS